MIRFYASQPHYRNHLRPIEAALGEVEGDLAVVAGWSDAIELGRQGRHVVLVEHGSGQQYGQGGRMGYSGSPGLSNAAGYVCPSEAVADRWRATYPEVPAIAVGCAKLDRYVGVPPPVGTVARHHVPLACGVSRESGSAFEAYRPVLPESPPLRSQGFEVLGHGHP